VTQVFSELLFDFQKVILKSQHEIGDPGGVRESRDNVAAGTIRVRKQTGTALNQATDIYGDANDKSLFNVSSQPVIAHWVE